MAQNYCLHHYMGMIARELGFFDNYFGPWLSFKMYFTSWVIYYTFDIHQAFIAHLAKHKKAMGELLMHALSKKSTSDNRIMWLALSRWARKMAATPHKEEKNPAKKIYLNITNKPIYFTYLQDLV